MCEYFDFITPKLRQLPNEVVSFFLYTLIFLYIPAIALYGHPGISSLLMMMISSFLDHRCLRKFLMMLLMYSKRFVQVMIETPGLTDNGIPLPSKMSTAFFVHCILMFRIYNNNG